MPVLTKEVVMLNYLFNVLYDIGKDEDFIEQLKDELEDEQIRNIINLSDANIQRLFKEPFSAQEIKTALKKANETFLKASEKSKDELTKKLESFNNSDCIKEFFLSEENIFIIHINKSGIYSNVYSDSVLRKITFEASEAFLNGSVLNEETVEICYDTICLAEENGTYTLELAEYFTDKLYKISFSDISVYIKAYSAESDPLFGLFVKTPYDYITALAKNINAHFHYSAATPEEKKIFGLVKHLVGEKIIDAEAIPSELYHIIEKHGLKNVIKPPYDFSRSYLCRKKFEPFWREILNLLLQSQEELPSCFEESITEEDYEHHKSLITEQMSSLGYEGTYPDYYKKDSVIKPTLIKTYNVSHIVAFEKYAEHHIRCYSFKSNDTIHTTLFVGTVFNKNDDEKSDIFSAMFNCDGKAVFSVLSTLYAGNMTPDIYGELTRKAVKSAVNKADLKKADKEDYPFRNVFERNVSLNFKALLFIFLLFTVGFSLIVPLLLIILDGMNISQVISFLKEEPFLLCFGVIGGFTATFFVALFEWLSSKK